MKSGSNLEKILRAGHFAFTGELGPPRGTNVAAVREKAKHLVGMGDAPNIMLDKQAVVVMDQFDNLAGYVPVEQVSPDRARRTRQRAIDRQRTFAGTRSRRAP